MFEASKTEVYMKIDVESSTIDCLDSLVHAAGPVTIPLQSTLRSLKIYCIQSLQP